MTNILLVAATMLALAGPAQADPKADITGVIQSQIDAFLVDDFATAFTYAAPGIKQMFGSSERFGMMVQQGYPMVWRPADVQFLDLRDGPTGPVQRVLIEDQAGARHLLEYFMTPSDEGWQISGVQLLPAPGIGA